MAVLVLMLEFYFYLKPFGCSPTYCDPNGVCRTYGMCNSRPYILRFIVLGIIDIILWFVWISILIFFKKKKTIDKFALR